MTNQKSGDVRTRATGHAVSILGIPVDDVTPANACRLFSDWLSGAPGSTRLVATVNPEFIMAARADDEFRRALAGSSLSTPDGVGVVLAARLLGSPMSGRLTGVDLVHVIAGMTVPRPRLFLLGAAPGIAERAAHALSRQHPEIRIAGCHSGSPRPEESAGILRRIAASEADTLLVAFGAPAQEKWIARHSTSLAECGIVIAIGVGGTFDFLAGTVPRAPHLVRRAGLEWLYRLIRQPWRWRRQLALPRFALLVLLERLFWKGRVSERSDVDFEH
jgi:N-acetylglucosaminyldiphosphoundecaprenol N-acetyl-beta-D-mannosaminyltransferase